MTSTRRLQGTSSLPITLGLAVCCAATAWIAAPGTASADPGRIGSLRALNEGPAGRFDAAPTSAVEGAGEVALTEGLTSTATPHLGLTHAATRTPGFALTQTGLVAAPGDGEVQGAAPDSLEDDTLTTSSEFGAVPSLKLRHGDELLQFDGARSGRWLIWGGLGPKANIGWWGWGGGQLGFEFFYHFKGHLEGPALGGLFRMPFGGYGWGGYVAFELGPIFAWNFVLPVDEVHMFIGPRAGLGFGLGVQTWNRCNGGPGNNWDWCDGNDPYDRGSQAYPYGWLRFGAQFGVQFPKAKGLVLGVILPEFDVNFGRGVWGSFNFLIMLGGTF
jgi:hypothetical protein